MPAHVDQFKCQKLLKAHLTQVYLCLQVYAVKHMDLLKYCLHFAMASKRNRATSLIDLHLFKSLNSLTIQQRESKSKSSFSTCRCILVVHFYHNGARNSTAELHQFLCISITTGREKKSSSCELVCVRAVQVRVIECNFTSFAASYYEGNPFPVSSGTRTRR